jgi:hypothetical protein
MMHNGSHMLEEPFMGAVPSKVVDVRKLWSLEIAPTTRDDSSDICLLDSIQQNAEHHLSILKDDAPEANVNRRRPCT